MLVDPEDVGIQVFPLEDKRSMKTGVPARQFDLILSHRILHRLPSLREILVTMYEGLKLDGSAALIDWQTSGSIQGNFHPEVKMGGVEPHVTGMDEMEMLMTEAGLVDVRSKTAFEMEERVETKPGAGVVKQEGATAMVFPLSICIGRKP